MVKPPPERIEATQVDKGKEDPGVQSVQKIYQYYKQHGHNTIGMISLSVFFASFFLTIVLLSSVMGASFRNVGFFTSSFLLTR